MTKIQVERWFRKLWEHVTAGDGYQPFGYDMVTMDIVHPGYRSARDALRQLWHKAA